MDENRDKGKRATGNPAREPRTIDLTPAAVVEETAPVASHAADPTARGKSEAQGSAQSAAATSAAPHDGPSGPGSDGQRSDGQDDVLPRGAWPPEVPRSMQVLAATAVLGGLVGALLTLAGWWLLTPRDRLVTRLTKLERSLDQSLLDAVRRSEVERVDNRVGEVVAGLKSTNDRLAAVSTKADETARRLAMAPAPSQPSGGAGAAAADLAEVRQRLDALEAALKAVDPSAARTARDSADKTAALATSLDGRVTTLERSGASPAVSRAVIALMLQRAVEGGKPYQAELAAMKSAGADAAALAPLERFAASGMPSVNRLTRDFTALTSRILAESAPAPADEGWLDRLARSAQRIVRVRPVDDAGGVSPGAVVTRIETALRRRDLPAVAAAWDSLPEGGRQVSREWGERLKARLATEVALQKLVGDGLATFARQETPVR
jgi:hypothetical protein